MKKIAANALKYLLELMIVAFGVFLGVYISEEKNQQKTDSNTRNAITQIISELNSNSNRLKSAISYHEKIGIELDSALGTLEKSDYNSIYFQNTKFNHNRSMPSWTGIKTVKLSSTIFESAKIGGVFQELNISTINLISSVYEFQNVYTDFSDATVDRFLELDSETKTGDVIQLLNRLSKYDILNMEKSLLKRIEKNVDELEKVLENKSYRK